MEITAQNIARSIINWCNDEAFRNEVSPNYPTELITELIKLQRTKDICYACQWLNEELHTIETADGRYPYDVESRSYFTAEDFIAGFRKTMEEQPQ